MIKILLVDDEREEREGISYLIQKYQYPFEILQAASGKEALQHLKRGKIDILLTDIQMPMMSGLELAKCARQMDPSLRIIIFSAYADFSYAKQAMEMSAVSYLVKPIEIEEFRTVMEEVQLSIQQDEERRKCLMRQEENHRKSMLSRFLTSTEHSKEAVLEVEKMLRISEKTPVTLLRVECATPYFESEEERFLTLTRMYLGQIEYLNVASNTSYVFLYEESLQKANTLELQLAKLIRDLKQQTGCEAWYLLSKWIRTTTELQEEVGRIHNVKDSVLGYANQIFWTSSYIPVTEHFVSEMEQRKQRILEAIQSGNVLGAQQENAELLLHIKEQKNVSKLYLQNLLYTVLKACYDKLPNVSAAQAMRGADAILSTKDPRWMLQEYANLMQQMLDQLGQEQVDVSMIDRIKRIIEADYQKDFSLEELADYVHLTPAYLSYLFKKETGQTLVSFMTDVKMKHAKLLLKEQSLKIIQIGRMLGYENQSYFNRLFKNYYGMTPRQYRETL
jgi:two-component system response regulator YesN